jgi:hypothetical protein
MAEGVTEFCEFWSVRSRRTAQLLGGAGTVIFVGFGVAAFTSQSRGNDQTGTLTISIVFLVASVALFIRAYFVGHLTLSRDHLKYTGYFGTHRIPRSRIETAFVDQRQRFPSPRSFNMPIVSMKGGPEKALVELCTPFATNSEELRSIVRATDGTERSSESLEGLVAWINSWLAHDNWISESTA